MISFFKWENRLRETEKCVHIAKADLVNFPKLSKVTKAGLATKTVQKLDCSIILCHLNQGVSVLSSYSRDIEEENGNWNGHNV